MPIASSDPSAKRTLPRGLLPRGELPTGELPADGLRGLDKRYSNDDLCGIHCQDDGHLAAIGLSEHTKCPGWWQTDIVDGNPVGSRCSCHCHAEPL